MSARGHTAGATAVGQIPIGTRLGRRLVAAALPKLERGHLRIVLPTGEIIEQSGDQPGTEATIVFHRWRAIWRVVRHGRNGLAHAWIDGDWSTPDLDAVFAFGLENLTAVDEATPGTRLSQAANRLRHWRRSNSRRRSRDNIAYHYDLGNAFYAHWLDRGMNYSSGLFRTSDKTLEEAQQAKLAEIVALLDLKGGEKVLEIGCGWGPLAEQLIHSKNCRVTGLTLSSEQAAYARQRLAEGHDDKADVRLQDYRDVEGRFDRIVSIEMIEAVGERYWPTFFAKLRSSLTDDGVAVLQAITTIEDDFDEYRRRPDFIQRYIFPGGMLPTKAIIREQAARAGLSLIAQESFGQSYALTLREWRRRFLAAWHDIETLGFDQRFKRLWVYYLAYCEAGFRAGTIDVGFFKLASAEGGSR